MRRLPLYLVMLLEIALVLGPVALATMGRVSWSAVLPRKPISFDSGDVGRRVSMMMIDGKNGCVRIDAFGSSRKCIVYASVQEFIVL